MIRSIVTLLAILLLVSAAALLFQDEAGPSARSRLLMGTVVEIRVLDEDPDRFADVVTAAFAEMERIEALMSPHILDSEINRLSEAPQDLAVSTETRKVLEQALDVSRASGGAFDAGLGRLVKLWGFAEGEPRRPAPARIVEALQGTGPQSLLISEDKVIKRDPRIAIDLGGVAKGYAIDRAIDILAAGGVRHASVNAGGDLRLLGDRLGKPWRIGIQHPRQAGEIIVRLDVADVAVVTSGDYERFFEQDGVRYHHILDPRTGYPASTCQAVTVVASDAMLADALATALFVLGPEPGLELLSRYSAEGLIVDRAGDVVMTSGMQEMVAWP